MSLHAYRPFASGALLFWLVAQAAACGAGNDSGEFSAVGGKDGGPTGGSAGAGGSAASAGAGGRSGGAGSDGGCPDADGDGQTTCAGDCDDANPNNYSTNTERCGDAVDNDCDNNADEGCQGLGTYVSELVGSDSNPGTQQSPLRTIAKGMANAQAIGGGADVFVAEGDYDEKVTLVEGISLLGGHQCNTTACGWAHDPKTHVSHINAQDEEGMLAGTSITRATRIDGFTIVGQDGAGAGDGRSALRLNGGTPIVSNNVIVGPSVSGGDFRTGRSFGVMIRGSTDAQGSLIENNEIRGGRSAANGADALSFDWSGNPANGVAIIRKNLIVGGTGGGGNGVTAWSSSKGARLEENEIYAGTCVGSTGRAWGVVVGGELSVVKNRINTDTARVGVCNADQYSGGLQSESSRSDITSNLIRGLDSPRSVGVMLAEFERPAGAVVLNGNTIHGSAPNGRSTGRSQALVLTIGTCTTCGFNARVGRIRNNLLIAGQAAQRFAVYEDGPSGRTQEPEAFENNLLFLGPSPGSSSALYREWNGSTGTPLTTIAAVNGMSIPNGSPSANISGDPLLDATLHLGTGSPAIDKGTATEAPTDDIDGQSRPQGSAVDIGADEHG